MRKLLRSFRYAFCGIKNAVKNERNFRIHIIAAISVIWLGIIFGIRDWEWAWVCIAICTVLGAELFNTAIEAAVDLASTEKCALGRIAKDSAAGAVLVVSIGAVALAAVIFRETEGWRKVFEYLKENWILVSGYFILALLFIFYKGKSGSEEKKI